MIEKTITLSEWSKYKQMHYTSAHRRYKLGKIKNAYKENGKIFVNMIFCSHCEQPIEKSSDNKRIQRL